MLTSYLEKETNCGLFLHGSVMIPPYPWFLCVRAGSLSLDMFRFALQLPFPHVTQCTCANLMTPYHVNRVFCLWLPLPLTLLTTHIAHTILAMSLSLSTFVQLLIWFGEVGLLKEARKMKDA